MKFDYIIVGAGFAGIVIAERIASSSNKKVLIIEKRNHIGGNCYDRYDNDGILVHPYGPHIFRTSTSRVWQYLSQFTEWLPYEHKVLGVFDGKKAPIPFNLNTLHEMYPSELAKKLERILVESFGYGAKIPILILKEGENKDLKMLSQYIYEKVYLNYTIKQWGMKPEELDPAVTGQVPVYISKDDRYFQDTYQGMPKKGYTDMFDQMLLSPNIKIMLNTDYREIIKLDESKVFCFGQEFKGKFIFTGKIDELFDYQFGDLPYRSLRFEFENFSKVYHQNAAVENYPNNYDFTRITEFKYLTGQKHHSTTIAREYPQPYERDTPGKDIPYYPIPREENRTLYERYLKTSESYENIQLIGRLAEYRYYNMADVVEKALDVFEKHIARKQTHQTQG